MQINADTRAIAATLLDWYREMGIDTAVADAPVDWLAHGEAAPGASFRLAIGSTSPGATEQRPASPSLSESGLGAREAPPPRVRPSPAPIAAPGRVATPRADARPGFSATPPDTAELAARSLAGKAATLDDLKTALAAFDGCGLKATAKNLCFYRGAPQSRLMIIGEAPGREEDLEGRPFVGRAGQLLDKMLAAIGLKEENVHITNVVYWRPPGNRTPTPQEAQVCRPFLERQMELVDPEIVLLLGGAAAKQVLGTTDGIMRIRGRWREIVIGNRQVKTIATLHPAYLLRTPAAKRQAWRDLLVVQTALEKAEAN